MKIRFLGRRPKVIRFPLPFSGGTPTATVTFTEEVEEVDDTLGAELVAMLPESFSRADGDRAAGADGDPREPVGEMSDVETALAVGRRALADEAARELERLTAIRGVLDTDAVTLAEGQQQLARDRETLTAGEVQLALDRDQLTADRTELEAELERLTAAAESSAESPPRATGT